MTGRLPQEIVDKTIEKYLQAYEMLTGREAGVKKLHKDKIKRPTADKKKFFLLLRVCYAPIAFPVYSW